MHPENYVANFQADKFAILLLLAIVFVPIQTAFEEFFFRGYLMQALGVRVRNAWLPLFFTSVTFGLMHIANPEVGKLGMGLLVYYIATGFFLGITTLMDDGLELAWGFHTANNFFTMLFVTSGRFFRCPPYCVIYLSLSWASVYFCHYCFSRCYCGFTPENTAGKTGIGV